MNNDNPVADPAEDVAVGNETSEEALITMNNENPVADPAEDAAVVDETSLVAQINNLIIWLVIIGQARRTHDNLWSRVSTYNNPSPQQNNPNMPNVLEKIFISAVAIIMTEDLPGIVDCKGQPGEYNLNAMVAITHYYDRKGWDGLDQEFLFRVFEDLTGETGGGRVISTSLLAQINNLIIWLVIIGQARRTHDNLWSRVSTYNNPSPQQNNPNMPNVLEKIFISAVAIIMTEDLPGIVDCKGQPGEYNLNAMVAITHYYDRKGWDGLDQEFLFRVCEDLTGENGGGRAMSNSLQQNTRP